MSQGKLVLFSSIVLILGLLLSLELGGSDVSFFKMLFDIALGSKINQVDKNVIFTLRLPQAIAVLISGSALALSGFLLQRILRNPLIDPGITGVSSGSALGIALLSFILPYYNISLGFYKVLSAFVFGICVGISLMVISLVFRDTLVVLVSGVVINAFLSSLIVFLQVFLDPYRLQFVFSWMLGSVGIPEFSFLLESFALLAILLLVSIFLSRFVDITSLGDLDAFSLGINVVFWRSLFLLIAVLLTSISVSLTGIIGFVGFVIPSFVNIISGKYLIGTGKGMFISLLLGGTFTLIAFNISKVIIYPLSIPIGVITGLIGAPIFLFALIRMFRVY